MDKKITPRQEAEAKRKYAQLLRAAYAAVEARDRFESLLDKTKERGAEWDRMCEVCGVSTDSNIGDWMC